MHDALVVPPDQNGFVMRLHDSAGHTELHWHEELEFNLIVSGSGYYVIGSKRHLLTAGTLIWLFPQQEHLLVEHGDSFCMWVVVFTQPVRDLLATHPERTAFLAPDPGRILMRRLALKDFDRLDDLARILHETTGDPDRFNLGISFLAAQGWHAFLHGETLQSGADLSPMVGGALRIIAREGGCVALPEVAALLNATPGWLSRSFHRELGITFTGYCQRMKVMRFCRLRKAHPGSSLTGLAYRAGFGSYAQFHRVFREVYGAPPSKANSDGLAPTTRDRAASSLP
jgi:AraC-like DNA-binding protein